MLPCSVLFLLALSAGDVPKVVTLAPENNAKAVDAKKTTRLVVTFDQSMDLSGWSFCGSGPNYPKFKDKPHWDSPKKIVVDVELLPDHDYALSLNCPAAQNFKSTKNVPLEPLAWSFHTAPDKNATGAKAKPSETKTAEAKPGEPPKIVLLEPANLAEDVDSKKTTRIAATFDRPMRPSSWSFCGDGPEFPKLQGKPRWESPTKVVADVVLEPDHEYRLGLNCPAAKGFQSADGVPLEPAPWSFTTAPAELPDPAKQKAENKKAFDALKQELAQGYSYYDLRGIDWAKLFGEHEAAILAAKTTRAWARAAANMLETTQDLHLRLEFSGTAFPAGRRAIDPLYRERLLDRYLVSQPVGARGRRGLASDGIGYLMVESWSNANDIDAIEEALPALKDCKALVVDVRPNSGGDESLAQRIAAWFVEGTKVYGKDRFRTGPGKDGFGEVLDRSVTGNADAAKRLSMPIAVLTSRYVMSSNESFVLMMRQAKDCTVVGQKTYGSSGNPKPHELPNGVRLVLPSWQDLRPDGSCFEGEGLAPDVEVPAVPKDFEEKDPILEKALGILREKIGKPGERKG